MMIIGVDYHPSFQTITTSITTSINELTSFMLLMRVLLSIWFYFVGLMLDRWIQ
jgi:hypothetical protein